MYNPIKDRALHELFKICKSKEHNPTSIRRLKDKIIEYPDLVNFLDPLDSGCRLLDYAAANGHTEIAQLLINNKAKIESRS